MESLALERFPFIPCLLFGSQVLPSFKSRAAVVGVFSIKGKVGLLVLSEFEELPSFEEIIFQRT